MDKFAIVRNAISPETIKLIKDSLVIAKDAEYALSGVPLSNTTFFGDTQSPHSWVTYSNPVCEALLLTVQPLVERETGKALFPTYSYARIYWKGATLNKHKDRPSCQYSSTINISNDPDPWPIFMEGHEAILNPGDLVVYKGMEVEHWREPYLGNEQIQIFLHFVDQNDIHANLKFDGRPCLGFNNKLAAERANIMLQGAVQMHQQGRLHEAKRIYEDVLGFQPTNADANHLLGVVYRQINKAQLSVEYISKAIEANPNQANFHFNIGWAYMDLADYNRSIENFEKSLALNPNFEDAKNLLAQAREKLDSTINS